MVYDFLIIGAGIAGLSLGAKLSSFGGTVVLEREEAIGYHSSGRSAAMFAMNYGNQTIRALNAVSKEPLQDAGVLSPRGFMVVTDVAEEAAFEQVTLAGGYGEIPVAEAFERIPALRPNKVIRAAMEPEDQEIDVDLLLQGHRRDVLQSGGFIETRCGVTGISLQNGVWFVSTNRGQWQAKTVVNAAGAWADGVAGMAGIALCGLQPFRRSVARVPAPVNHDCKNWPVVLSAAESWYARPDAGAMLVSPADEDPVAPMDAWADDMVLAEGLDRYCQFVDHEVTRMIANWAGLRTFVPDRTPVVGFEPDAPGFFWLAGQGGYGVQTSPALSDLSCNLITGQPPRLGGDVITRLSPGRFRS